MWTCGTGLTSYDYDAAGNLTSTGGDGAATGLGIAYDRPGQTSSIDLPGSTPAVDMAYDGVTSDRRTQSGTPRCPTASPGSPPKTPAPGTDAHGELFVRDPDGTLIAMLTKNNDGTLATGARYFQATIKDTPHHSQHRRGQ
jgi:hypothetical protein